MIRFLNQHLAGRKSRRAVRPSRLSGSLEFCESRTLLSGVALYPQPAEVVQQSGDVDIAAPPPENFAGFWNVFTPDGPGSVIIIQAGNQLQVTVNFGIASLPATGKVKADTAKIKINTQFMGYKVKGKIVSTLTSLNSMEGKAKVKIPGIGKSNVPLTGTRV
ncbi:MAG: hypothetical protein KDA68_18685 [Planctomycetaceae bacterium]|nr:hypothetical protein [Planctomycetaceae bacterium]